MIEKSEPIEWHPWGLPVFNSVMGKINVVLQETPVGKQRKWALSSHFWFFQGIDKPPKPDNNTDNPVPKELSKGREGRLCYLSALYIHSRRTLVIHKHFIFSGVTSPFFKLILQGTQTLLTCPTERSLKDNTANHPFIKTSKLTAEDS